MRIVVDDLSKSYGRVMALRDVSLSIDAGQVVALLGANGAGKTTLLRALAGIAAPTKGSIYYDDQLFRRDRSSFSSNIAMLFFRA